MATRREIGKKSRAAGSRFELKVRKDLEDKGWIVDKWGNNVEFVCNICEGKETRSQNSGICDECGEKYLEGGKPKPPKGKLIKAKPKFVFNPGLKRRIPMGMSSGFPDFVCNIGILGVSYLNEFLCFECIICKEKFTEIDGKRCGCKSYEVIGVESKMNGKIDKEEKEKCKWLLDNNIFSKILIASKGTKRGEIIYKEFEDV